MSDVVNDNCRSIILLRYITGISRWLAVAVILFCSSAFSAQIPLTDCQVKVGSVWEDLTTSSCPAVTSNFGELISYGDYCVGGMSEVLRCHLSDPVVSDIATNEDAVKFFYSNTSYVRVKYSTTEAISDNSWVTTSNRNYYFPYPMTTVYVHLDYPVSTYRKFKLFVNPQSLPTNLATVENTGVTPGAAMDTCLSNASGMVQGDNPDLSLNTARRASTEQYTSDEFAYNDSYGGCVMLGGNDGGDSQFYSVQAQELLRYRQTDSNGVWESFAEETPTIQYTNTSAQAAAIPVVYHNEFRSLGYSGPYQSIPPADGGAVSKAGIEIERIVTVELGTPIETSCASTIRKAFIFTVDDAANYSVSGDPYNDNGCLYTLQAGDTKTYGCSTSTQTIASCAGDYTDEDGAVGVISVDGSLTGEHLLSVADGSNSFPQETRQYCDWDTSESFSPPCNGSDFPDNTAVRTLANWYGDFLDGVWDGPNDDEPVVLPPDGTADGTGDDPDDDAAGDGSESDTGTGSTDGTGSGQGTSGTGGGFTSSGETSGGDSGGSGTSTNTSTSNTGTGDVDVDVDVDIDLSGTNNRLDDLIAGSGDSSITGGVLSDQDPQLVILRTAREQALTSLSNSAGIDIVWPSSPACDLTIVVDSKPISLCPTGSLIGVLNLFGWAGVAAISFQSILYIFS